jgi:hypothetical protein
MRPAREPARMGTCREVNELCKANVFDLHILPPRSPYLEALDYAVFGHSKRWLAKRKARSDDRCAASVDHLQALNPTVQTKGFKRRLQALQQAKGGP